MKKEELQLTKNIKIDSVLDALESGKAANAVLIGPDVSPREVARLHSSKDPKDIKKLQKMEEGHEIMFFKARKGCPLLIGTLVDVAITGKLYIVKDKSKLEEL